MKYFESFLKLAFVAQTLTFFKPLFYENPMFLVFLETSFILGIVLLLNKKQSYGYTLSTGEIIMRKIEGTLLVIFSIALFFTLNQLTTNFLNR